MSTRSIRPKRLGQATLAVSFPLDDGNRPHQGIPEDQRFFAGLGRAFQSFTVRSDPPVAISAPSGEKASVRMPSVWPT